MSAATTVYTDGACSGNPGPGGWAWVVPDGPFASGAAAHTTNQRMELQAVLEAVRALDGELHVRSDSTYVVNCFRDRWWEGWLRRGWVNSQRKPVANRDLWEPLVEAYRSRTLSFEWVRGHSDDPWNDLADRLAVEAAARQEGRTGDRPPDRVGPADAPATADTAGSAGAFQGHSLLVVGHRPPGLGGYGETATAARLRERLQAVFEAKRQMHEDLVVVTGLGLGAETLGAEAAQAAGVPFEVVLAHPGLDAPWPEDSRRHFRRLSGDARAVRTLGRSAPESRARAGASFARRDGWLRANVDEAVAVWDGDDPVVGRTVRSLVDALGEENVWVIDPSELA